jgi:transposase
MLGLVRLGAKEFLMTKKKPVVRRQRRSHTPEFKARVALAALREDKTMAQLCREFELAPQQIMGWKRQLLEGAGDVFGADRDKSEAVDLMPLQAKIGQLTLENDFLERALTKAGLLSAKR